MIDGNACNMETRQDVRILQRERNTCGQGASVIVKSFNKDRMKENLQILDWELSNEEIARIQEIPQCRGYKAEEFVHPDGPYKSIHEFWDGEL
ncbi:hypothetical protein BC332_27731 [Capsicum chinense]|uniref:Non-functional NADPH-dependent codeinone reductase 2-like n=1 Tax=Capsicum annuum TaxID=4072 RepID=A0A2G2YDE2_CAPAN|nr:hypothetical protein T459_27251 [Capsicum annuum]PHU02480.1 hypothetical protein BC332_27731 [Capsicum chinense]